MNFVRLWFKYSVKTPYRSNIKRGSTLGQRAGFDQVVFYHRFVINAVFCSFFILSRKSSQFIPSLGKFVDLLKHCH